MNALELSDADLVAQSLAGSREAFTAIVARYQSLICSINYSATGNLNQSEDLAQETFLAAWKDLPKLREPSRLRAWLCRISRNLACDSLRAQGREPSHHAESLDLAENAPAPEPLPIERAMSREEQDILWRAIERIPETYREALVLFYRQGQSVQAVARNLDLTEDAAKQRLSRGRKLLQEQVLAFVEGALERTNPGHEFTASVMAALPALSVSARVAAAGATAAKGSAAAKAATAAGIFGAIFVPALVFFGNFVGYRMSMDGAWSDEERSRIKGLYKSVLRWTAGCFVLFAALIWWIGGRETSPGNLTFMLVDGVMVIFLASLAMGVVRTMRGRRRYLQHILDSGLAGDTVKPVWEYRSRLEFLGLPLVHIRIGDRFAMVKGPVKAWVAIGEWAVGGLIAFGGLAVAPLPIGGLAIGLLPYGGLAMGIFALGGLALGVFSIGGIALGWMADGGCALAWHAAAGGIAMARDYAIGGFASAHIVNNSIADAFVRDHWFFRLFRAMAPHFLWMNLLWVGPMFLQWRVLRKYRHRAESIGRRDLPKAG